MRQAIVTLKKGEGRLLKSGGSLDIRIMKLIRYGRILRMVIL